VAVLKSCIHSLLAAAPVSCCVLCGFTFCHQATVSQYSASIIKFLPGPGLPLQMSMLPATALNSMPHTLW
jgi:hypothetical protein